MQRRRYRYGFHCRWTLCCLGLVAPLLTSGCAPGSVSRLSGVGCADPSCNTAMPETRKVLACIGDACDEPSPPSATQDVAGSTEEENNTPADPGAASSADSPAPEEAEENDGEGSAFENLKIHYERFERPD